MRPTTLIAAALAAVPLASAQNDLISALGMYPVCGQKCTEAALPITHCGLTNSTCLCTDMTLQNNVTNCVLATCTTREALSVKNITLTACHAPIRDRSREHLIVNDVLGVISALFIIQRFAFKLFNKTGLFWDDWFALATIVSGAPSTVMNAYGLNPNGIGRDVWTLTGDQITKFGYYFYFIEILYFFQVTSLKLSLLFFYLRIFPDKKVQKLLWGSVVVVVLFGVSFIFVGIFQCTPVSYFWTKWDGQGQGTCLDTNIIGWTNGSISIALDLWMLAIPLSQLRGLRMNIKKKIGVAAMLCVGTFVTVVSILRLQSLVEFKADTLNPTWDFFSVALWSDIEINVGIMCICMPSLRVLLTRLWPKVFGGSTNASYVNYSHHYNRSNRSGTAASKSKRPANASAVSAGFGGEDLPYDGIDDRYGGPIKMDHMVYNPNSHNSHNSNNSHHDGPPLSRDGDEKSLAPKRSPQEW